MGRDEFHIELLQITIMDGVFRPIVDDELVKSRKLSFSVIPAKAGNQSFQAVT